MALIDGDRFEGRFRDGVHVSDTSDLMRRLTKERLLKFDGTPLFPERRAYTVNYRLSEDEARLYHDVTAYVQTEFNRADQLQNEGRRGTVGFALTILQRRLASSPEAIFQSICRRRERLEKRVREEKLLKRGAEVRTQFDADLPALTEDLIEDLDDAPDAEVELTEEKLIDRATAAQTIAELEMEIETLKELESLARDVCRSGNDTKWTELACLLQDNPEMFDANGSRRKLVIFTEHRDTLNYLTDRIRTTVGRPEAVVTIHGGMGREDRKKAQDGFIHDSDVQVLVATDAAGEGINLQRAHLMVNYDLPWNPNRLEQRFGRIHRIGQNEVCHLWNLVAEETREGDVYRRLLQKLDTEKEALGGAVFDVLGAVFQGTTLRQLLLDAIRYGDQPEVKARLHEVLDQALERDHLIDLIQQRSLTGDALDESIVNEIRIGMERAAARRLQPFHISAFFMEAFTKLGGTIREREPKRHEISRVPPTVRSRDRQIGVRIPILPKYERVTFEKDLIVVQGKPLAAMICPGHPLLDCTVDLILEQHRSLLRNGTVLVDWTDDSEELRILVFLEHAIHDAHMDEVGNRRVVSRRMQFVEIDAAGHVSSAGHAPYLDYEPITQEERALIEADLRDTWIRGNHETTAKGHAIEHIVPDHFEEVRTRREELIDKTKRAVHERLTKEITYWDHRAQDLKAQQSAGKQPKMNWQMAQQRADDLQNRLARRLKELEEERQLAPSPPQIMGGAIIVPQGLLSRRAGSGANDQGTPDGHILDTKTSEKLAMDAVMAIERELGFDPRDVSSEHLGYDIESVDPASGHLRFVEVKGRVVGADTVTLTRNEITTGLNKPGQFILAIVMIDENGPQAPRYVLEPFEREPDFGVTSVNYGLKELLERGRAPR